ncbi:MAG: FtsQ-type POTRA domain-containing protein [Clostridia bacterium]|nr:FtsQ-type POTRA domain-containing protein [Ruminococcus sp.]MBR6572986.1 FtsQ-type POTRA domain-containing protein [Clostridia bacterium]
MEENKIRERERRQAAEKAALRKKKRRRRRRIKAFLSFLLIAILTLAILSLTVFFKIDGITVKNNTVYTSGDIISASGVEIEDNLFALNSSKIEQRITKNLPFIKTVELKRQLPSKLCFVITETEEEVCYYKDGVYYSADKDGKILKEYTEQPSEMILIKNAEQINLSVGEYVEYTSAEEKDLVNKHFELAEYYGYTLNTIDVRDVYNSTVRIDNRFIVEFGTYSNIELKAAHLNAMLKQMEAQNTGIIDLKVWTPENNEAFFSKRSIEGIK